MAGNGATINLLLFYTLERILFNRMVGEMGKEPKMVKKVMALWFVLEEMGYHDLIRFGQAHDNFHIEALFREGLLCLECIQPDASEPKRPDDIPTLCSMFDEPLNRRFFYYHREFMYARYLSIMVEVCDKIFGETRAIEPDASGMQPVVTPFGEGTSTCGQAEMVSATGDTLIPGHKTSEKSTLEAGSFSDVNQTSVKSGLNPNAKEFFPDKTPDEARTMFLTFSNGNPLSREEIKIFFISTWDAVVQEVFIEQPANGAKPLFAKVKFSTSLVIPRVLNGQHIAKFKVNGKHLWARIYNPRLKKSRRNEGNDEN